MSKGSLFRSSNLNIVISPFMSGGDNQYHVILHERFDMEVFPLFRTFDERQLNLSREEGFEHLDLYSRCEP